MGMKVGIAGVTYHADGKEKGGLKLSKGGDADVLVFELRRAACCLKDSDVKGDHRWRCVGFYKQFDKLDIAMP